MSNEELVEQLGQLIDTADNYLEYTKDTTFTKMLPQSMRMEALCMGLKEVRTKVFEIHGAIGGENHWEI
jgi:uncharacterized protein with HEPN domain